LKESKKKKKNQRRPLPVVVEGKKKLSSRERGVSGKIADASSREALWPLEASSEKLQGGETWGSARTVRIRAKKYLSYYKGK